MQSAMESGKGKGTKHRGKGGKFGAKRHHHFLNTSDPVEKALTKPAIRRLARRSGIKRVANPYYKRTRKTFVKQLTKVVKDALIYAEHARRRTITLTDGLFALKRNGQTTYHTTGNSAGVP